MKTIKKIWSILLVCGLILVPTISVSAAEQEPEKVEVSFFNENGEEVTRPKPRHPAPRPASTCHPGRHPAARYGAASPTWRPLDRKSVV